MTPYPLRALPTAAVPHCRGGVLGLSCWLPAGGSGSLAAVGGRCLASSAAAALSGADLLRSPAGLVTASCSRPIAGC